MSSLKQSIQTTLLLLTLVLSAVVSSSAAVPQSISYQALLRDNLGAPVPNGSYSVAFTIYDAPAGGTNLWTETQSVTTSSGLFTVLLGSGPIPIPDAVFSDTTRYLGIKVGADPEMSPRVRLATVPYSFRTSTVDGASGGMITGSVGIGTSPSTDVKLWALNSGSEGFPLTGLLGRAINGSTGDARGIVGIGTSSSGTGYGVYGDGNTYGVYGTGNFYGLYGNALTGTGVYGTSNSVGGQFEATGGPGSNGVFSRSTSGTGVFSQGGTYGVFADGSSGTGVYGTASQYGVYGQGDVGVSGSGFNGVEGIGATHGVLGTSSSGTGVYGVSTSSNGVVGNSNSGIGVYAVSTTGPGVQAFGGTNAVEATGTSRGVYASGGTIGVLGVATSNVFPSYGIYGSNGGNFGSTYAGYFVGMVYVSYDLEVDGIIWKDGGGFKIDHPTDPANKYLYHSFVESPDMKNIYDGVVVIDAKGEAVVYLPDWFGAENRDFRYQLTAIGAPGPNLHISKEISNNHFRIAGGTVGMKVSWQVTGIRQDAWANVHRFPVEEEKTARERGKYKNPKEHGVSETLGIHYEEWQKADAEQEQMEASHTQQEKQRVTMEAERKLQEEQRVKPGSRP